ncbi:hypothetical protein [Rufibacter immobilis]|uniref:hypothetical protein n=1 Tax=Rufibacter immobilis TaxID=1348778 RepID=UPI0035E9BB36
MNIETFLSHKFHGENPECEFQFVAQHQELYYRDRIVELRSEMGNFYSDNLYNFSKVRSEKYAFLDYHLGFYKGDHRDFLDFVFDSIDLVVHEDMHLYYPAFLYNKEKYARILRDWCEERKNSVQVKGTDIKRDIRIKVLREGVEVSAAEIEAYYRKAFITDKSILTEEQLAQFLGASFSAFKFKDVVRMSTKGEQKDILEAVYKFYKEVHLDLHRTFDYLHLLIDNFHEFTGYINPDGSYDYKGLGKNFSRYYVPS